ncbi:MAG: YbhB/YbcL family Raf kinase inhibitor-like protein [Spirochaetaceae bacterium]
MKLTSTAFSEGSAIPEQYSCDGQDISPPLHWQDVPAGTETFVLIADDPDAPVGTWVHWVIYDIPGRARELQENYPKQEVDSDGSKQGTNDFKKIGYGGPCPPGGTHRYFFKLYALDTSLDAEAGLSKKEIVKRMEGHVLDEAQLMGTYSR